MLSFPGEPPMYKSLALSTTLFLAANAVWAESDTENPLETKVDSRVLLDLEHSVPRLVRGPSVGETSSVRFVNSTPVMILLDMPATKEILSSLEAAGAQLRRLTTSRTPSRPLLRQGYGGQASPEIGEGEDDGGLL
jgi:hypothetical protein